MDLYSTLCASRPNESSKRSIILSRAGQRCSGDVRSAFARHSNSKSQTHRNCPSILASVSRLTSQPQRRQRAASIGCVSRCRYRSRRICGPTKFRGPLPRFLLAFFFIPCSQLKRKKPDEHKGSEFRTNRCCGSVTKKSLQERL